MTGTDHAAGAMSDITRNVARLAHAHTGQWLARTDAADTP